MKRKFLTMIVGCMIATTLVACGDKKTVDEVTIPETASGVMTAGTVGDTVVDTAVETTEDVSENTVVEDVAKDPEVENGAMYIASDGKAYMTVNVTLSEAVFMWCDQYEGNDTFLSMTGDVNGDKTEITLKDATDTSEDAKTYKATIVGDLGSEDSYIEFNLDDADFSMNWKLDNTQDKNEAQKVVESLQTGIYDILSTYESTEE